ncbi:hypothetical protein [Streptomyces sp. SudanB182_2057]|uniref:hypothetical protein n=1 Tax=Streptomyces sp. SudanB182_2057 TaxID=3035281 RepID=UPI003F558A54
MRRFRSVLAAAVTLAAFAGVGVAAAPAQAATYCTNKGQKYFCEYGVSTTKMANGTKEEFVVGSDHAVWTNWTYPDGSWNGWVSMDGWVQSRIEADAEQKTADSWISISAVGGDGNRWFRVRYGNGTWSDWQVSCFVEPNGRFCP